MKRWVVGEGDGPNVDAIVGRSGDDARAIDEGRVFVGPRRAKRGDPVRVGDEVIIHPEDRTEVEIHVLHHGEGLLAVDKPAGISTIPDQHGAEGSLLFRAARRAAVAPETLHATSRLDRGVSGVVVFVESARARERVQAARASGAYDRRYVALTAKAPSPRKGAWDEPIGRARDPKKRMVRGRDATNAVTRYEVAGETPLASMLRVEPVTGRTHQIRVHASHAGVPLLGDRDYGGARTIVLPTGKVLAFERIALHCAEVRLLGLALRSSLPEALRAWWSALGGGSLPA
jgi:23S rRNA pseudouridine1911/1915/1917 synthase